MTPVWILSSKWSNSDISFSIVHDNLSWSLIILNISQVFQLSNKGWEIHSFCFSGASMTSSRLIVPTASVRSRCTLGQFVEIGFNMIQCHHDCHYVSIHLHSFSRNSEWNMTCRQIYSDIIEWQNPPKSSHKKCCVKGLDLAVRSTGLVTARSSLLPSTSRSTWRTCEDNKGKVFHGFSGWKVENHLFVDDGHP